MRAEKMGEWKAGLLLPFCFFPRFTGVSAFMSVFADLASPTHWLPFWLHIPTAITSNALFGYLAYRGALSLRPAVMAVINELVAE